MSQKTIKCLAFGLVTLWSVSLLHAQPDFYRTKVVDPTAADFANFNDIQAAINDIGEPGANDHWTVLIYPGVYEIDDDDHPLIHLDDDDERISLVGVDRQSVIIKVTTTGSGIKITSGDETSRDCRIANLTIQTTNGHGIEMVKPQGAQTPKNITIEGVTIEAAGTEQHGIDGAAAEDVRIANCEITTTDGHGIRIVDSNKSTESPRNVLLHDVTIRAAGRDKYAIRADGAKGIPRKQRLRVNDLLLYDEAAPSEPNRGARKP